MTLGQTLLFGGYSRDLKSAATSVNLDQSRPILRRLQVFQSGSYLSGSRFGVDIVLERGKSSLNLYDKNSSKQQQFFALAGHSGDLNVSWGWMELLGSCNLTGALKRNSVLLLANYVLFDLSPKTVFHLIDVNVQLFRNRKCMTQKAIGLSYVLLLQMNMIIYSLQTFGVLQYAILMLWNCQMSVLGQQRHVFSIASAFDANR